MRSATSTPHKRQSSHGFNLQAARGIRAYFTCFPIGFACCPSACCPHCHPPGLSIRPLAHPPGLPMHVIRPACLSARLSCPSAQLLPIRPLSYQDSSRYPSAHSSPQPATRCSAHWLAPLVKLVHTHQHGESQHECVPARSPATSSHDGPFLNVKRKPQA